MPIGRTLLKRSLNIDEKRAARSREKVLQSFERMNELLSDSRPYLCGDTFSAADLSFACMAAPVLLVSRNEGYGAHLPATEEVPAPARDFALSLRESPAGIHAMRMFRDERSAPS